MNWWHETSCDKTKNNAGRNIVFANTVGELEVLVKHCFQRERNALHVVSILHVSRSDSDVTYL